MEIKSKEIKIVDIDLIIENPKNPNRHSEDQIKRLTKLIKNTGFRSPLIVSNKSGFLIVGHGRLAAAKAIGMKTVPVIFEDFKNEADEYAFMCADNAIAEWSELDLSQIGTDILDFGPEFDIEELGMKNFSLLNFKEDSDEENEEDSDENKKFILQVELPNELELRDLYDDLLSKGYMVKEL